MNIALPRQELNISYRSLLSIYVVLPLFALAMFFDALLAHGALQKSLPATPYAWRVLTLFLVYPHIIASTFSLVDQEYSSFYKVDITKGVIFALGLTFLLPAFSTAHTQFLVLAVYTVYHVMNQQLGIAALMWGKPSTEFLLWKWLFLTQALLTYLSIYSGRALLFGIAKTTLSVVSPVFFIGFIFLTYRLGRQSETRWGTYYLWANCFMALFVGYSYAQNYIFFAILGPRIIHDLSAFVFYIAHDHNRNRLERKNLIYRIFATRVPVFVVGPLLAIILANLFLGLEHYYWVERFLLAISFFHYYIEGVVWKRGCPHRKALSFTDAQWGQG